MEPQELRDYRDRLLDALEDQPSRAREERPTQVQVFINQERAGVMDCAKSDPSYCFASRERSIQTLELRSEAGILLGGVSAPEAGVKHARIPFGRGCLHIQIHNKFEGGSAKINVQREPAWWGGFSIAAGPSHAARLFGRRPAWISPMAVAQIVLAVTVLGLLADRIPEWMGVGQSSALLAEQRAAQQAMQEQFARLEQRMGQLADNQQAAMQSAKNEQEHLIQLSRHFEAVSQAQQKLSSQVGIAQEELQAVKSTVVNELDNGLRVAFQKAEAEQQVVHQELQSVKSVNETLVKQVALLESKNRELHARLALASNEIAKATAPTKPSAVARSNAGKDPGSQTQVAEARRETDPQAFMFWVSFQDGTPEKSIEDLIQEIKGIKKGPMNSGWYPVEVNLPKPEPPDRFLESVKRAKIVKAVATSKVIPPAQ